MSCDITSGRIEQCKDSISGLKNIFFANFDDLSESDTIAYDTDDQITSWTPAAALTLYQYELKGEGNSLETTINSSRSNGTTFFTQTLNIRLKRQDAVARKNVKLLSFGRPRIICQTMSNQFFLLGFAQGCDVSSGTVSSGENMGDFNGYSLTFEAQEQDPPYFLDCSTIEGTGSLAELFQDGGGTDAVINDGTA
jgi:hypothetical protein